MRQYFSPVKAWQAISARDENKIREFLNSLQMLLGSGSLEASSACGMTMLRRPLQAPQFFYAQITGNGVDADDVYCYSYEQMDQATNGGFTIADEGITGGPAGNPLYEINGIEDIPDGTIVRVWPGFTNEDEDIDQEFLFDANGSGSEEGFFVARLTEVGEMLEPTIQFTGDIILDPSTNPSDPTAVLLDPGAYRIVNVDLLQIRPLSAGMFITGTYSGYINTVSITAVDKDNGIVYIPAPIVGTGTGIPFQSNQLGFGWKEQDVDPISGAFFDKVGGRFGTVYPSDEPAVNPALELNGRMPPGARMNAEMNKLIYPPSDYIVYMRFRTTTDDDIDVYEFAWWLTGGGGKPGGSSSTGSPTQTSTTTINYYGSPTYPTYIFFGPNLIINYQSPIYMGACIIFQGGTQPTTPPSAPTVAPSGSGSGMWGAGTHYLSITIVDSTGRESQKSPQSAAVVLTGSQSVIVGSGTLPAAAVYWKIYATPVNSPSGTTPQLQIDPTTGDSQFPVATTTITLGGPWTTGATPPTSAPANTPPGCFVPPASCRKPTFVAKKNAVVIDICDAADLCTGPQGPVWWVQVDSPQGSNWRATKMDPTVIAGFSCPGTQLLGHVDGVWTFFDTEAC